jgi:hypothetical protein
VSKFNRLEISTTKKFAGRSVLYRFEPTRVSHPRASYFQGPPVCTIHRSVSAAWITGSGIQK